MNDKNPLFAENINRTQHHPVKEFLTLFGVALLLVVALTIILSFSIRWFAPFIPFSYEEKLISKVMLVDGLNSDDLTIQPKIDYLQQLGDSLASAQGLPEEMPLIIHWIDDEMVNAFASLGGHIFITKGLWDKMPNENALAMVLAHEIAHVKHRDPIKGLSVGVSLSLLFSLILGGDNTMTSLLGSGGILTSLHFTRAMEQEADSEAIKTLYHHYGHIAGFTDFFEIILKDDHENHLVFLETHPLTEKRIELLESIKENNNWPIDQMSLRPLPRL